MDRTRLLVCLLLLAVSASLVGGAAHRPPGVQTAASDATRLAGSSTSPATTPTATATPTVATPDEPTVFETTATPSERPALPNPAGPDADGDGLPDAAERAVGTDAHDGDTDDDGLPDGAELDRDRFPGADPLHRDVFVEVDYVAGERPQQAALDEVRAAFAAAPVSNPDGTGGIALHLVVDDELPRQDGTDTEGFLALREAGFDNRGRGYHYAVAVADVAPEDGDTFDPAGRGFHGGFWFEPQPDADATAMLFMHELGHALGLDPGDHAGIDGRVPFEAYPSVMNYEAPWGTLDYSHGPGFDDWEHVAASLADRLDTSRLDAGSG